MTPEEQAATAALGDVGEQLVNAGKILMADGISYDRSVELVAQFVRSYVDGDVARNPEEMARHFVELRRAAR